jgi:hypothetical protein
MEHVDATTERPEQSYASDAQNDFLLEADFRPALIQAAGKEAVFVLIRIEVRVQQEKINVPYAEAKRPQMHGIRTAVHRDHERVSVRVEDRFERMPCDVDRRIFRLLGQLLVEVLLEIAIAKEKADSRQWDTSIGGGFEVIARQDAEAPGVHGKALVKTELHAEIGRVISGVFAGSVRHVRAEVGIYFVSVLFKSWIVEYLRIGFPKGDEGIISGSVERIMIETSKKILCFGVPAPPEIVGEFIEFFAGIHSRY